MRCLGGRATEHRNFSAWFYCATIKEGYKTMEKLNKYLNEAIRYKRQYRLQPEYIDFLTWEGFGKLWEWAKEQEWWHPQFEHWLICDWVNSKQYGMVKSEMVDPENFAKAVAEYLQNRTPA